MIKYIQLYNNDFFICSISVSLFSSLKLNFSISILNTSLILHLLNTVRRMPVIFARHLQFSIVGRFSNSVVAFGISSFKYFRTFIKSSVKGRVWIQSNLLLSKHLTEMALIFLDHSTWYNLENLFPLIHHCLTWYQFLSSVHRLYNSIALFSGNEGFEKTGLLSPPISVNEYSPSSLVTSTTSSKHLGSIKLSIFFISNLLAKTFNNCPNKRIRCEIWLPLVNPFEESKNEP